MKNSKKTKHALVSSVIAMILCLSMLIGTTFAWFTDSVQSGINEINAGNLDIGLTYVEGASTKSVTTQTVLFDGILWEPGAVAYETLTISNEGSLALKYAMNFTSYNENNLNGNKLSDILKIAVVEEKDLPADMTDRNAMLEAAAKSYNGNLREFRVTGELYPADNAQDKASEREICVVIYWEPSDKDNLYNVNNGQQTSDGNPLYIDFKLTLNATQLMHEKDSFGEDYDENATFPEWVGGVSYDWYTGAQGNVYEIATAEDLAGFAKIVNGTAPASLARSSEYLPADNFSGKTVLLAADIDLGNLAWTPIGNSANSFQGTFDGKDHTIKNLAVGMTGVSNVGLFGMTTNGEIKNLTVENAMVTGRLNVGVVAGTPYTSKYSNITVTGHVEVNGMAYVGGVGGKNAYANWDNIKVDVDDTSYVKANSVEKGVAYRTYVGGVIGFMGEGGHTVSNVTSNIDVIGSTCDVGGIVGIAHYGNNFEDIKCSGDVTITGAAEAGDAEEMGGIAGVWMNNTSNVTFTDCEFTGKLSANLTDGVDLADNTITGKAYGEETTNQLIINGKCVWPKPVEWDGTTVDTSWYNETGTEFGLDDGADLAGLAQLVDEGNTFEGKTLVLDADIDLANKLFDPIGSYRFDNSFKGTFDGQGYTISNLSQNTWDLKNGYYYNDCGLGLFGAVEEGTVKNLIIDGAKISGETALCGTIAAVAKNATFENITVKNANVADYQYYAGGIVGWASGEIKVKDCNIDASTNIAAQWGDFDNSIGGVIGGASTNAKILLKNTIVACRIDAYNDVTSSYRWYAYRRAGMLIGNSGATETVDGRTVAAAPQLTCDNVTVIYGDWANYTYCEFAGTSWPYVRVQEGVSNSAYSNPRYGHPTDANGNQVVDDNHVHNEGEDHHIPCVFDQLYGGGQGVYGNPTHNGVKVIYNNN